MISPVVLIFCKGGSAPEPVLDVGAVSEPEPVFDVGTVSEPEPGFVSAIVAGFTSMRVSAGDGGVCEGSDLSADSVLFTGCAKAFLARSGLVDVVLRGSGLESGFGCTR